MAAFKINNGGNLMIEIIYATITAIIVSLLLNFLVQKLSKKERKRYYPAWISNILMAIILVASSGFLVSWGWFYIGTGTAIVVIIINQMFPTK